MGKRLKKRLTINLFDKEKTKLDRFCLERNIYRNDFIRAAIEIAIAIGEDEIQLDEKSVENYKIKTDVVDVPLEKLEIFENAQSGEISPKQAYEDMKNLKKYRQLINSLVRHDSEIVDGYDLAMTDSAKLELKQTLELIKEQLRKKRYSR